MNEIGDTPERNARSRADNWHRKQLRIVELIGEFGDMVQPGTAESEVTERLAMHANAGHMHTMGMPISLDSCYFKTGERTVELPDHLADYTAVAREQGIRTIVYFNVHWGGSNHEDWAQRDPDGKPLIMGYGADYAICVNGPFREIAKHIAADLGRYDIDGVFLDGPIFVQSGCYCDSCRRLFKERYGLNAPQPPFDDRELLSKWLEFRADSLQSFLQDLRSALDTTNPDAIMYANAQTLRGIRGTGVDNRKYVNIVDIMAAEGGFIFYDQPSRVPVWKPGAMAKFLENEAGGKPTLIFLCADHKPYDRYLLPAAETRLLYAQTIANGASIWYAIVKDNLQDEGADAAVEMMDLMERLEADLSGTEPLSDVAIVFSPITEDYYGTEVGTSDFTQAESGSKPHGHSAEAFFGMYESLVRAHIPFDVLDDVSLTDGTLSKYKVLVLPNIACISDETAESIRQFVRNGGSLLATFATSLFDSLGRQRDDFALADVFGVHYAEKLLGPLPFDYVNLTDAGAEVLGKLQRVMPTSTYAIAAERSTAESLIEMYEKLPSRYVKMPPLSGYPAMTMNRFGSGTAYYITCNADEFYWTHRIPEHHTWLTAPVTKSITPRVRLENAPDTVEIILRKQSQDRLLIHLINSTGNMHRPITSIVPLHDLEITLNEVTLDDAKALVSGSPISIRKSENGVTLLLPKLETYEIIACTGPGIAEKA